MRHYYTYIRMAKIKNSNITNADKIVKKNGLDYTYIAGRNINGARVAHTYNPRYFRG